MRHLPWAACALALLFTGAGPLLADDHIVETYTRTYMGRNYPTQTREYWITDQAVMSDFGTIRIIQRHDLGKKWTLNMAGKRYMEEPLEVTESSQDVPVRMQERGFNYEPRFDWLAEKTRKTETVNGWPCEKWILRGDADYAEEVREVWYASEVPINMVRYFNLFRKPNMDDQLNQLFRDAPSLKSLMPIQTVITTENAIAPVMVSHFDVTTLEQTTPPENVYDIPEGFTRVDSREALFAR